jgi:hypothetical protein
MKRDEKTGEEMEMCASLGAGLSTKAARFAVSFRHADTQENLRG